MDQSIFKENRKSTMLLDEVYFWTDTVKDWKNIFNQEKYKQLVIKTCLELTQKKLIRIYGFVIMPNHLHIVWEMLAKNRNEMPSASFNKAIGHLIIKDLKLHHSKVLPHFEVKEKERSYRIWQRDPLAVLMDSRSKVEQKLEYIHNNPLQEKWKLAKSSEQYFWSSANFYETGEDPFGFLTHYMDRF